MGAVDRFVSIIPPMHRGSAISGNFMFVRDDGGRLFESVQQNDPRKVPTIHVLIVLKSAAGAHFSLRQAFRVYASYEQTETLSLWNSGLAGFDARYQQEISRLKEARRQHRNDEWESIFGRVKEEFSNTMGEREHLTLRVDSVPTHFILQKITKVDFDELMAVASYPQIVSELYDCPAELDGRR